MSNRFLRPMEKGLLFVVSAPAGTGKTTLVSMLSREFSGKIVESISFTTRPIRKGEVDGAHYHFVSKDAFEKKIEENDFYEYAEVFGFLYGTSKSFVEAQREQGKHVVLVIDTQGAMQIKSLLGAVFIFLTPPSLEVLKQRLGTRKSESEEAIAERLSWAEKEMAQLSSYHYHIVNDDLQTAYQILRSICIAETHKTH